MKDKLSRPANNSQVNFKKKYSFKKGHSKQAVLKHERLQKLGVD